MNKQFFKKIVSASFVFFVTASMVISPLAGIKTAQAAGNIGTVTGWAWSYMPDRNDDNITAFANASHQGNVGEGMAAIAFSENESNPGTAVVHDPANNANSITLDNAGNLSGYAWSGGHFGVTSPNGQPWIGWINFCPGGLPPDTVSVNTNSGTGGILSNPNFDPNSNTAPNTPGTGTTSGSPTSGTNSPTSGINNPRVTPNNPKTNGGTPVFNGGTAGVADGGFVQQPATEARTNVFDRLFQSLFGRPVNPVNPKVAPTDAGVPEAVPGDITAQSATKTSVISLPLLLKKLFAPKIVYAQQQACGRIDLNTGVWSGWARAVVATNAQAEQTGGWDGWISLRGTGYGVQSNLQGCTQDCATSGFAWGDMVMGWIGFAGVKVTPPAVDMCENIPDNQTTVPLNAIHDPLKNTCDYCQNIARDQASVPNNMTQTPWPNGLGFNCEKETNEDMCPNDPPGGTVAHWTATVGHVINPGNLYCIVSNDICEDEAADNYGLPGECEYTCKNPNAINQGDPLPCQFPPGWCVTHPEDCPVTTGKPIYEET